MRARRRGVLVQCLGLIETKTETHVEENGIMLDYIRC